MTAPPMPMPIFPGRSGSNPAAGEASNLRDLLDHLPDGVLLLDTGGVVVWCNPAAERLFGLDAPALAGQCASTLLGMANVLPAPSDGDATLRRDGSVLRPDGSRMPVEAAFRQGVIAGESVILASVRDLAPHQAALERERTASERRRDYFRSAAHELRTPMASILGFSELLLKRDFPADTGRELLGIIHQQSSRLVALVNQMLDLARIEAGGPDEQERAAVRLTALAADIAAAARDATPARAADLVVSAGEGVPPVLAHPGRVRQALANILDNAMRFSAPGSRIEIAVSAAARDGLAGAEAAVRDRGPGMTVEQRERMFDVFYRAGERPELEGSGIGLAQVREIVAFHGGAIEVVSAPGAGTTVTVWLPADPAPSPAQARFPA